MSNSQLTLTTEILRSSAEIVLSATVCSSLIKLLGMCKQPTLVDWLLVDSLFGLQGKSAEYNPTIDRIYLGNEFCDRLISSPRQVRTLAELMVAVDLPLTLITPVLTDESFVRILPVLDELPKDSEVVVNDWGMLRRLNADYPHLDVIAGRQFCKMIKDPRLPTRQWQSLYPPGFQGETFQNFLVQHKVGRLELDVPPFAEAEFFRPHTLSQSAYVGYGFVSRGRICKIGSLHHKSGPRFGPRGGCRFECRDYVAETGRISANSINDLTTFQRGNTMFYRHSAAMVKALEEAVSEGWVDRLIFTGDWHENNRTH